MNSEIRNGVSRRAFLLGSSLGIAWPSLLGSVKGSPVLDEPIEIGMRPQLFIDDALIDNRYALSAISREIPLRKFHVPTKHEGNPVLIDPGIFPTYPNVRYDCEKKLFRAWYQAAVPLVIGKENSKGRKMGYYHIRYAESTDGIHWIRPKLGLYEYDGNKENNICFAHPRFETAYKERQMTATRGTVGVSSVALLNEADIPEADLRGYRYLMNYSLRGGGPRPEDRQQTFLIGSQDGIHWDYDNQQSIAVGTSDGWFGMEYDIERKTYVAFVRPRDRYEGGPSRKPGDAAVADLPYEGVVRRIARMESDTLWKEWEYWPQTVLLPDAHDKSNRVTSHMAVGVTCYHGYYFGFLIPFVPKESLWAELLLSHDGKNFERTHHRVISTGPQGAWDCKQAWTSGQWVEVGDEWRMYYFGSNSEPNWPVNRDTIWGIGMVSIRKEGFVSLNASPRGGVVVTRLLKWPGGNLLVNCNSSEGEMRVRVTTKQRETIPGFDYADCMPFQGDRVAEQIVWKKRSLAELKDQEIRLEFLLPRNADLYSFRGGNAAS